MGAIGVLVKSLYNLLKDLGIFRVAVSSILKQAPKAALVGNQALAGQGEEHE